MTSNKKKKKTPPQILNFSPNKKKKKTKKKKKKKKNGSKYLNFYADLFGVEVARTCKGEPGFPERELPVLQLETPGTGFIA